MPVHPSYFLGEYDDSPRGSVLRTLGRHLPLDGVLCLGGGYELVFSVCAFYFEQNRLRMSVSVHGSGQQLDAFSLREDLLHVLCANSSVTGFKCPYPSETFARFDGFYVTLAGVKLHLATELPECVRTIRFDSCRADSSVRAWLAGGLFALASVPDPPSKFAHGTPNDSVFDRLYTSPRLEGLSVPLPLPLPLGDSMDRGGGGGGGLVCAPVNPTHPCTGCAAFCQQQYRPDAPPSLSDIVRACFDLF